jgi:alpha-2-macroglobulin
MPKAQSLRRGTGRFALIYMLLFLCAPVGATQAALTIQDSFFESEGSYIPLQWSLFIQLSHQVRLQDLDSSLSVTVNRQDHPYSLLDPNTRTFLNPAQTPDRVVDAIAVMPDRSGRLQSGIRGSRLCSVEIAAGLRGGRRALVLESDWGRSFNVYPPLRIESVIAEDDASTVNITFSAQIDERQLRDNLQLFPAAPIWWWQSSVVGNVLSLKGRFMRGRQYRVSLPAGFRSSGAEFAGGAAEFTVPDHEPQVYWQGFEGPSDTTFQPVVERDSRQLIHANTVNIEQLLCETLRVTPLLIPYAEELLTSYDDLTSFDRLENKLNRRLSVLRQHLGGSNELMPFLLPLGREAEVFFSQGEHNNWEEISLPLSFRSYASSGGVDIIRVRENRQRSLANSGLTLFRVSDICLSYKQSANELLVWATSLATGQPLPSVRVIALDNEGEAWYLGVTDNDGLLIKSKGMELQGFSIKSPSAPQKRNDFDPTQSAMLVAAIEGDATFISFSKQNRLEEGMLDGGPAASRNQQGILFADRGIYRPGDLVFIKGMLRELSEEQAIMPIGKTLHLSVLDSRQQQVYRSELICTSYGSVQDSLSLKSWAALGQYTVHVGVDDQKPVASTSFQVQEYRPPRHYCDIRFRDDERVNRDYVNREVAEAWVSAIAGARYYAGGPVTHGKLRWQIRAMATSFNVPAFADYKFGNVSDSVSGFLESGEALLDKDGELPISIPLGQGALKGEYGLQFEFTALDFDGRSAAVTSTWQKRPRYLPGIAGLPDKVAAGQPQDLRCLVLGEDGQPVRHGKLELRVLAKRYSYIQKRDSNGNYSWTRRKIWVERQRDELPLSAQGTPYQLHIQDWGNHRVELKYADRNGEVYRSSYLLDSSYTYDHNLHQVKDYPLLQLAVDKHEVNPGEFVQLKILPRSPLASALFCIDRGGHFEARLFPLKREELEFKVTDEMEPNVYVSVLGTLPRSTFPRYRQQEDLDSPGFVYASKKISVRRNAHQLSVELLGGPENMAVEPGDWVELNLGVFDHRGKAIPTEVTLGVIDEAVLTMTNWNLPESRLMLNFDLPLQASTGETRKQLLGQELDRLLANLPLTGGDGDSEGERGASSTTGVAQSLRMNFNPVAYFNPTLQTGSDGRVHVKFRAPDTMTRYRIYAFAADQSAGFGSMRSDLTVMRPFYIEPGLPRFFTIGDQFQAELAVFNRTDSPGSIDLELLSSPEMSFERVLPGQVIKAQDRSMVAIRGEAVSVGEAEFTARARFIDQEDGVRIKLPVRSGSVDDHHTLVGKFAGSTQISVDSSVKPSWVPSQSIDSDTHYVRLSLSRSPLLQLQPGLRYLIRYPYGCVEQTSSTLLPLASLRQLIINGQVPSISGEEVDPFIAKGVERLLSMRLGSGGFSYWPGGREANAPGSLYALTALQTLSESGYELPGAELNRSWEWLLDELRESRSEISENSTLRAWGLYLLARSGRHQSSLVSGMISRLNSLPKEAQAFTLLAAGIPDPFGGGRLADLAKAHLDGPTWASATQGSHFRAQYRADAVRLLALNLLLPGSQLGESLAASILAASQGDGRWSATSDTGWCLLALASHYEAANAAMPASIRINVEVVGGDSQTVDLNGPAVDAVDLDPTILSSDFMVNLTGTPPVPVYYTLALCYPLPPEEQENRSKGFKLSKRIENLNGSRQVKVGDVVKVTLVFDPDRHELIRYLVLDDPLPAGLVAINSALSNEMVPAEADSRGADWYWRWRTPDGLYQLHPSHSEMKDDRVLAFADRLWGGPWEYSYYARAVCAGSFVVPASKVQLMYEPEKMGLSEMTRFEIEEH